MTAALAFLWNNKTLLLLAIVIITSGLIIGALKIDLAFKTAKITDQASKILTQDEQIKALTRQAEIMQQNATAAKEAHLAMQKVLASSEQLKKLVNNLPDEVTKGFKNETMERVNSCMGRFFRDGVLPEGCGDPGTVLPPANNPRVE